MIIIQIITSYLLGVSLFLQVYDVNVVKRMRVDYLPRHTTTPVPISCSKISGMLDVKKKTVLDGRKFIDKVTEELVSLKEIDEQDQVDVRIKVYIDYQNRVDTLCLGEYFGTLLNGKLMEDNPKLLDLIKAKIY